jgi:hypothetical protein
MALDGGAPTRQNAVEPAVSVGKGEQMATLMAQVDGRAACVIVPSDREVSIRIGVTSNLRPSGGQIRVEKLDQHGTTD